MILNIFPSVIYRFSYIPKINSQDNKLQVIPQQLCYNAGIDATDVMNKLRHRHFKGHFYFILEFRFYFF